MNAGNHTLACPMLEESQRLDPGGGTLLNLALCHENSGKLALAKREYEESLVRARADRRKDREKVAAEAIARLVARIPRVGLLVHETAADLVVRIDGAEVPRPEWSSVALDPGTHTIEATASGRLTWQASIVLSESQVTALDIPVLSVLAPEPSPLPPPPSPLPPPPPPDVHVGAPVPIVGPPEKKHWLFWPMVGTSGAALGTSAVTGILALVEKGNADAVCNASRGYCINSKAWSRSIALAPMHGSAPSHWGSVLPRPPSRCSCRIKRWVWA